MALAERHAVQPSAINGPLHRGRVGANEAAAGMNTADGVRVVSSSLSTKMLHGVIHVPYIVLHIYSIASMACFSVRSGTPIGHTEV